jgi:hypothetical protein
MKEFTQSDKKVIDRFIEIVERRAEANMLKTGKLEGSHYAAMKAVRNEIGE